jgi:hypothetical protein
MILTALTALTAFAAGSLLVGFISLDWRFFAASGLASLAVIAIGIKAAGWHAFNPRTQNNQRRGRPS